MLSVISLCSGGHGKKIQLVLCFEHFAKKLMPVSEYLMSILYPLIADIELEQSCF